MPKKALKEEVQSALWQTYLPPGAIQPFGKLSDSLEDNQQAIPKPLLGIAAWNLFVVCAEASITPPKSLEALLRSVLDLSTTRAVELHRARPANPLAPFSEVFESLYASQTDANATSATAELCMPADFDTVERIAEPSNWPERSFLWSTVPGAPPSLKLNLPQVASKAVQLTPQGVDDQDDPLATVVKFECASNDLLKTCNGSLKVAKERGKPGLVRVTNKKAVRFTPGTLADHESATLKYWLVTETVSWLMRV